MLSTIKITSVDVRCLLLCVDKLQKIISNPHDQVTICTNLFVKQLCTDLLVSIDMGNGLVPSRERASVKICQSSLQI